MQTLVWPVINFAIFAGLLFVFLRKPLQTFVRDRHDQLKTDLETVRDMLRDAQGRFEEFSAKLDSIEVEISVVRDDFKKRAEETKAKIIMDAQRMSTQMVEDAKRSVQTGMADLKNELKAEFAEKAIQLAEGKLRERLDRQEQVRIRREFSSQLREGAR